MSPFLYSRGQALLAHIGNGDMKKLSEYKKKRDFKKTAEPKPGEGVKEEKNRFVLHYHAASHLHYDLRLEIGGVLKSWAVPRGLPTRKSVKKLAVQVEDHPIEYLSFEGQIPEGQYGAGQVKIFDSGIFEPLEQKNLQKQLLAGKFSFLLIGKKIQAALTLIKTKRAKDWLLLMPDTQALNPWIKSLGEASAVPERVSPMKANLVDKAFDSKDFLFEVKWDGLRAIAYLDNGNLSIKSRNFIEQSFRYPELADIGDFVFGTQAVLDGEIVVFDEEGRPSFQKLQSRINLQSKTDIDYWASKLPAVFYIFDVLFWEGRNLMKEALLKRKKVLRAILMLYHHVQLSEWIDAEGLAFFQAAKQQKLEGIIAKRKDSPYVQRRTSDWLKIKTLLQQEVVIGGWTEPRATRPFFGALLLGVYENSRFIYIGHAGTGFDYQTLKDLYEKMRKLEVLQSPFEAVPIPNEPAHWVKPVLVAQVRFSEWTRAGRMRQPVFIGLRTDVGPKEVRREIATSLCSPASQRLKP